MVIPSTVIYNPFDWNTTEAALQGTPRPVVLVGFGGLTPQVIDWTGGGVFGKPEYRGTTNQVATRWGRGMAIPYGTNSGVRVPTSYFPGGTSICGNSGPTNWAAMVVFRLDTPEQSKYFLSSKKTTSAWHWALRTGAAWNQVVLVYVTEGAPGNAALTFTLPESLEGQAGRLCSVVVYRRTGGTWGLYWKGIPCGEVTETYPPATFASAEASYLSVPGSYQTDSTSLLGGTYLTAAVWREITGFGVPGQIRCRELSADPFSVFRQREGSPPVTRRCE